MLLDFLISLCWHCVVKAVCAALTFTCRCGSLSAWPNRRSCQEWLSTGRAGCRSGQLLRCALHRTYTLSMECPPGPGMPSECLQHPWGEAAALCPLSPHVSLKCSHCPWHLPDCCCGAACTTLSHLWATAMMQKAHALLSCRLPALHLVAVPTHSAAASQCRWLQPTGTAPPAAQRQPPGLQDATSVSCGHLAPVAASTASMLLCHALSCRPPVVQSLAAATEEEVNEMWAGLGYYRRARFLLQGARHVQEQLGGQFPLTSAELQKLPGEGPGRGMRARRHPVTCRCYVACPVAPSAAELCLPYPQLMPTSGQYFGLQALARTQATPWPPSPVARGWDWLMATLCECWPGFSSGGRTPSRAPGCMLHWLTAWWRPSGPDASTRSGHLHGTLKCSYLPASCAGCRLKASQGLADSKEVARSA